MVQSILKAFVFGILCSSGYATPYTRSDSVAGNDFLNVFQHQAIADPTHGYVNYVSQAEALAQNLTYASDDTFIMRADFTTTLSASDTGRNSVRIMSYKQYTTHVLIMDIKHMPEGCATWPAAWEVGDNWPNKGEFDIVEGVNGVSPNQATLHTSAGCTMPSNTAQTGYIVGTDCNANVNNNLGCGVKTNKANSFAGGFNAAGGGWYATERTDTGIKAWFWSRSDGDVPDDVRNVPTNIDTSTWGVPFADFPNTDCDLASKFGPNNIVINLTFCGDWAGATFNADGCGSDCVAFVTENPYAFVDAFWEFTSLNVYE